MSSCRTPVILVGAVREACERLPHARFRQSERNMARTMTDDLADPAHGLVGSEMSGTPRLFCGVRKLGVSALQPGTSAPLQPRRHKDQLSHGRRQNAPA